MRNILVTMINSDPMPELLMHIIRYVMPSKDKELKKLLYFYWEICEKYDSNGKLRHEMILVCNAIQRDLQHPNEFIRGNTLRFLNKLKEPELLETLVPNCRVCLEHRHAYVRKNAVFAIYSIFRVSEHLIPDAPDLILDFLNVESDATCRRNAFVCLSNLNREASLRYIQEQPLDSLDPLIQLAIIEFIRKDALQYSELKSQYLQIISSLLEISNTAVAYEAATTLSVLDSSPTVVKSAASKFVELAIKESDINVKLIALERISELHTENEGGLEDICLDILKVVSSPSVEVRNKAIEIGLKLVSSKNVDDVVKLLKKELQKTNVSNEDKTTEYRQTLISAIHSIAIKFHEIASSVVDLLLEFIGELNTTAASEVIAFIKQVIDRYPDLRTNIVNRLLVSLANVKSGKVYRGSLWILGENCLDESDIQSAWKHIRSSIGEIPILASEKKLHSADDEHEVIDSTKENGEAKSGPKILADGTYATESSYGEASTANKPSKIFKTPIRSLILDGDFYLASVLSSTLVKLLLRLNKVSERKDLLNALKAEAMLIMVSILRVGDTQYVKKKIDEDSSERIMSCIRFLSEEQTDIKLLEEAFLDDTAEAFKEQLEEQLVKETKDLDLLQLKVENVDQPILFRQFSNKDNKVIDDNEKEIFAVQTGSQQKEDLSSRLNKIVQLTGFSDPVYAEAYVKVHQFDVTLDVLIVNQTTTTLRNLNVEFAALGDLKVIDKPSSSNIAPHAFHRVQTTIKVSSADTGVIFGNIVYDGQHADESTIVILSDVHIDILDYIKPATCTEAQFRKMWNEFEWENKISVNSTLPTLKDYLEQLLKGTNMKNLTPGAIIGDCQFLSANLYSKSTFGEDALANLCIEKSVEGPIVGHVRIRSKGQGLALSLGDKVAAVARKSNTAVVTEV
jgi:coatomer subunit beta